MDFIREEIVSKYKPIMHNVNLLVKYINLAMENGLKIGKTVCGFNLVVRNNKVMVMFSGTPIFIIDNMVATRMSFNESIFNNERHKLNFINEILK